MPAQYAFINTVIVTNFIAIIFIQSPNIFEIVIFQKVLKLFVQTWLGRNNKFRWLTRLSKPAQLIECWTVRKYSDSGPFVPVRMFAQLHKVLTNQFQILLRAATITQHFAPRWQVIGSLRQTLNTDNFKH